jgi:predicted nuclease of predicted toxin-antitoxin system
VKPLDWPILADENIDRRLVLLLRDAGLDLVTVVELGLAGSSDATVLETATSAGRVVLTQDADFGALAVHRGDPYVGILYLRPGDLRPQTAVEMLAALGRGEVAVEPPFIVVVQHRGDTTRIRIRTRATP